jgi:hypothetical protein
MENEIQISKDGKFIVYDDLIHEMGVGTRKIDFDVILEIFKEQSLFLYENKQWDNNTLISVGRKLIYEMDNASDIILEYEKRFQNLLTESVVPYRELNEGLWSWLKEKGSQAVNFVKEKAKELWNKGLPWFFNKLRDVLNHPAAIAADVALTAIGVGKVPMMIIWGALLAWEIKELIEKGINFETVMNVIFAAVGVLVPALSKAGKVATKGIKNVEQLAKTSMGGKLLTTFTNGFSKIINGIADGVKWLSGVFGSKVQSLVSGAINNFKSKFNDIVKFLTPKSGLTGKKVTTSMVGSGLQKGAVAGAAFHGGEKLLTKAAESEKTQKAALWAAQKVGLAPSDEEMQKDREKIERELANTIINDKTADDINDELLNQLKNTQ